MPIDHLMITTSQQLHWPLHRSIIGRPATIYPLTVSEGDLKVPYTPLLFSGLRTQANIVASTVIHNLLVSFAAFMESRRRVNGMGLSLAGIEQAVGGFEGEQNRIRGNSMYIWPRSKGACLVLFRVRCQGKSKEKARRFCGNGSNDRIPGLQRIVRLNVDFRLMREYGIFMYMIGGLI